MNKKQLINDLRFILSKYESNLETELYPIEDSNTQSDLNKSIQFIEEIIMSTRNSLEIKSYTEDEYQEILLDIVQKIDASNQFQNSDTEVEKKARQTIVATSNEIKIAM
jgi:hypothetical protein